MPHFSLIKIFTATIIEVIVLSGIYFYSFYYRFSQLNQGTFNLCLDENLHQIRACANRMMFFYLTEPSWIAIQFTLLVIPAAVIAYLFCHRGVSTPFIQSGFIALLSSLCLTYIVEQGAFAGLTALLGILLGGLLAKRRLDHIVVFNNKNNLE